MLGIAGAFLATFIGRAIGYYGPDQGAGFITATVGALVALSIWNRPVVKPNDLRSGRASDERNSTIPGAEAMPSIKEFLTVCAIAHNREGFVYA